MLKILLWVKGSNPIINILVLNIYIFLQTIPEIQGSSQQQINIKMLNS